METRLPDTARHCAYCGHLISADVEAPGRVGERFCSDAHADEFAAGVRVARIDSAARREAPNAPRAAAGASACDLPTSGEGGWRGWLKRAACWGAPLLLLIAIPLVWSGGWAATGGSLLTVLALLACPLGMYFMMRGMMNMQHPHDGRETERGRKDRRA